MLKAGKPSTAKTAKELAIAAVKSTDIPVATEKPQTKRFNADISAELHRAIKARAATEGVALNELTTKVFNEYLSKAPNE